MIFLDFETRSRCDLKAAGGHAYAAHPSTEVLCLVAVHDTPGKPLRVLVWVPHETPPLGDLGAPRGLDDAECWEVLGDDTPPDWWWQALDDERELLVAHNAEAFDRPIGLRAGLPDRWLDSVPRVRRAGLPGHLAQVARRLYPADEGKDAEGKQVMLQLAKPHPVSRGAIDAVRKQLRAWRAGAAAPAPPLLRWLARDLGPEALEAVRAGRWHPSLQPILDAPPYGAEVLRDPDPAQLTALVRYCAQDVGLLRCLWHDLGLGRPHVDDPVLELDVRINRRGVAVDQQLVAALLRASDLIARDAGAQASLATDGAVTEATLRSRPQLLAWLADQGVVLPDVKADTVAEVLRNPGALPGGDAGVAATVLRARLAVARVAAGKLRALRDRAVPGDGGLERLHCVLAYYGAHTGRWAGRGVQPQNLPRPPKGVDEALADDVAAGRVVPTDSAVVGGLIRSCLVASPGRAFAVVDYRQIEARIVLWLAGEDEALATFTEGDPYAAFAARLWPGQEVTPPRRQVGKAAVLGCGFGAGPDALARLAAKGGVDLAAAGVRPVDLVETWRGAHPRVAGRELEGRTFLDDAGRTRQVRRGGLWRKTERAAHAAVTTGEVTEVGRVTWSRDGLDLVATLPSGRALVYHRAHVQGEGREAELHYTDARGPRRTYGGKLVENVVQAVARDLLAAAQLRVEAAGFPVVLHVHDELVAEVGPADLADVLADQVAALCAVRPPWAHDLPVDVEHHSCRRYGK